MAYFVRSRTDRDDGCEHAIVRAVYPEYREEPGHPTWFPARQLGAPREGTTGYVAVGAGTDRPVGFATLWELRPKRYRFDLAVRPENQRQGVGTELLSRVMAEAREDGATGLQARVRDDKSAALDFVGRHGFRETHRMGAYRIDFTEAQVSEFRDTFHRLRDRGFEVSNLAAQRETVSDWLERMYELRVAASEGWVDPDPDPNGPTPIPFAEFQRWIEEVRHPESFFIASHQGRYVAFTSMFDIGTAVHPEYRRRGIATLIKAGSIADAHRRGLGGQTTNTASPAMGRVFEKLGYRRLWSEVRLIRSW